MRDVGHAKAALVHVIALLKGLLSVNNCKCEMLTTFYWKKIATQFAEDSGTFQQSQRWFEMCQSSPKFAQNVSN